MDTPVNKQVAPAKIPSQEIADMNIMRSPSSASGWKQEDKTLLTALKGLVANNKLLINKKLVVENIASIGTGAEEMVSLDFSVPRPTVRSTDPNTGIIRVQSRGPRFKYTFSAKDSLQKSLREFRSFYAKRAHALTQFQDESLADEQEPVAAEEDDSAAVECVDCGGRGYLAH